MSEATPGNAPRKPSRPSTSGTRGPRVSFRDFDERDLVSRAEAAQLLCLSRRTLEEWATTGDGPPFVKMGNGRNAPARYRVRDLLAYIEANLRRSTTSD